MGQIDFAYRPLPIHAPFHRSGARERALFGAFGSGKTYALCAEAIAWCLEHPGIRGLVTRYTIPELRDTTEQVFMDIMPPDLLAQCETRRMGGHYERIIMPNGSEVLFRSIDDWQKMKSLNVGFIAWDEADEFDPDTYAGMASRVRQVDPTPLAQSQGIKRINRRGMFLACNPAGHNWLYQRFVDPKTKQDGVDWFRSTSFDNPHLPPDYLNDLLAQPEPYIRRYVLCQFDDFAGQIYEDWNWDDHVIEPLKGLPQRSIHWMGMDPGTRHPTAGLWVYLDSDRRRLVGVAEYAETRLDAAKHAQAWRRIEAQHKMNVQWRVADPSMNVPDRGSNMTLRDQYRRLGFNFNNGAKDHKVRIPALGQLIAQRRFVVTRACPQAYEQIKNYKWEDLTPAQRSKGVDPREVPIKKDDDLVDCAQYISGRWVKPLRLTERPTENLTPHQELSQDVQRAVRVHQKGKRFSAAGVGSVGRV